MKEKSQDERYNGRQVLGCLKSEDTALAVRLLPNVGLGLPSALLVIFLNSVRLDHIDDDDSPATYLHGSAAFPYVHYFTKGSILHMCLAVALLLPQFLSQQQNRNGQLRCKQLR